MISSDLLAAVKTRVDIGSSDTTFDAFISQVGNDTLRRLWPRVGVEVDKQTLTITPDSSGQAVIDLQDAALTTKLDGFRSIEVSDGTTEFPPQGEIYQYGTKVRIRGLTSGINKAVVYGLIRPTLANLPTQFEFGFIYMVAGDFYQSLVGNKRKFNEYMQNGVTDVDEMLQIAETYDTKGDNYITEQAPMYGRQ